MHDHASTRKFREEAARYFATSANRFLLLWWRCCPRGSGLDKRRRSFNKAEHARATSWKRKRYCFAGSCSQMTGCRWRATVVTSPWWTARPLLSSGEYFAARVTAGGVLPWAECMPSTGFATAQHIGNNSTQQYDFKNSPDGKIY